MKKYEVYGGKSEMEFKKGDIFDNPINGTWCEISHIDEVGIIELCCYERSICVLNASDELIETFRDRVLSSKLLAKAVNKGTIVKRN